MKQGIVIQGPTEFYKEMADHYSKFDNVVWATWNDESALRLDYIKSKGIEVVQFDEDSKPEIIIDEIGNLNQYLVFGIGNIVGWGDKFVQKMKEFKISD